MSWILGVRDRGKGAREGSRYKVVPSRAPTARHGWFCGASSGRLAGTTCLRTDSRSKHFICVLSHLRHFIGFLSHRWQKERNVFERVRRRKHLETHRNSWEFKSSSLWGASGGAGEALSYVLSLTDQTLPQRLSPFNFPIVFSFFFFFCCQYQIFLFYCFCFLI